MQSGGISAFRMAIEIKRTANCTLKISKGDLPRIQATLNLKRKTQQEEFTANSEQQQLTLQQMLARQKINVHSQC